MNRSIFFSLLLLSIMASALEAQTASLRGQVTDPSGAAVPGARVSAAGPGRRVSSKTADALGIYRFDGLAPGPYEISATAPELVTRQPLPITLTTGPQSLDLQLVLIRNLQQLTVRDEANPVVGVDPTRNASGITMKGEELQALGDNPDDLLEDLRALAGPAAGPNGASILIDGFSGGELPPKQSIREVRINQDPFSAEYDRLGLGRIEIFTKPGTDKFAGSLIYNFSRDLWNARNPYSAVKAPLVLDEFEGNIGGSAGKRSSFTLDLQRYSVDNGSIINAVTLAPATLNSSPLFDTYTTAQKMTRFTPRWDQRLSENNNLSIRYFLTKADINGSGIGNFALTERGYRYQFTNQNFQVTDTAILGSAVNDLRFQYFRSNNNRTPFSTAPALNVLGAFQGGGNPISTSLDTQQYFELQNYTTVLRGKHTLKFGIRARGVVYESTEPLNFNGTYTFGGGLGPLLDDNNQVLLSGGQPQLVQLNSIERYRRTLLFQRQGLSPAQIRLAGGGANQFTLSAGEPFASARQIDTGIYFGEEWRMRRNLTLNLGLRYENQTNISSNLDFAPRIALAWAPGGVKGQKRRTVIRLGSGIFFDRFGLENTLAAQRFDGIVQQQYVVTNPDFFPAIPSLATLNSTRSPQVIERVSPTVNSPYLLQTALSLERQLQTNTTLALTYTNSRGVHMLRSLQANAPLPGTFIQGNSSSGVFPQGSPGALFLTGTSGSYNQNILTANLTTKIDTRLSLATSYTYNRARSNTDGIGTFPANPYDYSGEYGPAATDIRHRVSVAGTINLRWNFRLSPLLTLQSGAPFDITSGNDLFNTTLFNGRPGVATNPAKPGLIQTKYGLLDPNPGPNDPRLGRNFGRGPAQYFLNLRAAKTIGFGGPKPAAAAAMPGPLGLLLAKPQASRRYSLIFSVSARNLLNHTNPGPIIGNITSPLFGQANQVGGRLNGEGFSENANNRKLEMQVRFSF